MEEIQLGQYALPVILTMLLGLIYYVVGVIPNRIKPVIAVLLGVALSLVAMHYAEKPWVFKVIVDYVLYGFMVGASAVGIHQIASKALGGRKKSNSGRGMVSMVLIICMISFGTMTMSGCGAKYQKFTLDTSLDFIKLTQSNMEVIDNYLQTFAHYSGAIWKAIEPIKGKLPADALKALEELTILSGKCPPMDKPEENCDFEGWEPALDFDYPFQDKKHYEFATGYSAGVAAYGAYVLLTEALKILVPIIPEIGNILSLIPILAL